MAIRTAPLNILTFPQQWDAPATPGVPGRMRVRYLCFPRMDPDVALAPGQPAFADAELAFEARVIPSFARLPDSADIVATIGGAAPGSPLEMPAPSVDKAAAFAALGEALKVAPRKAAAFAAVQKPRRILKPETASWRARTGAHGEGRFLVGKHAAKCAIHESMAEQPLTPPRLAEPPQLRWGEAMAFALRTEPLALALGLIGEVFVEIDQKLLSDGGWLVIALHASSDYAADPLLVSLQAARVPPLDGSRSLYSAALFPLDQADYVADEAIGEALLYANGFARRVHVAQAFDEDDDADGTGDGDCIHIAWDDAQLTEWLNRQSDPDAATPMGTFGYRVDVRDVADGGSWHSLQTIKSITDLSLGAVDLGGWEGERPLEVAPLRRGGDTFWLPAYFATWRGSSLALTDPDFVRLQQAELSRLKSAGALTSKEALLFAALAADKEKTFAPVGADAVPLRYGRRYAFRVRLADLTHGGPPPEADTPADPDQGSGFVAEIEFRRFRRPGAVEVTKLPTSVDPSITIARPTLRFPELRFAGDGLLDADASAILKGKPDPDVRLLRVALWVRALSGDRSDWQQLYSVERPFTADEMDLPLAIVDVPNLVSLAEPDLSDRLPIPTERELKLVLTPIGRDDESYFAKGAHVGVDTTIPLRAAARSEAALIALPDEPLIGFFLRQPGSDETAPRPLDLLTEGLGLASQDLTLSATPGTRTVLACGAALRHTPSPDGHFVQFASDTDLRQRWITAVSFVVERDWSWRALAAKGLVIERSAVRAGDAEDWQPVGIVQLPSAVARDALPLDDDAEFPARLPERQSTRVVFLDAVNPLAIDGNLPPSELEVAYRIALPFDTGIASVAPPELPGLHLPVTTPPRQHPRLVSAGIALGPYVPEADYSATNERRRHLWLEFEEKPDDPGDSYFARVLAIAPDPLLVGLDPGITPTFEPALALEAEWIRRIVPGQAADASGSGAMPSVLKGGRDGRHVIVPLPPGMNPDSPELAGMFTYELRLGHSRERWCTAHGRWGPPLRIAGVQHPPPPLRCEAARVDDMIAVVAPFGSAVHAGKLVRQWHNTRLWAVVYARVAQADGQSHRNLLLLRKEMTALFPAMGAVLTILPATAHGVAAIPLADIREALEARGLPEGQSLTALAVEFFTDPAVADPIAGELGEARIFRASPLVPVPEAC
jgi:hypothetical protein